LITRRSIRIHHALAGSYLAYAFKRTKPPLPCLFNIDPSGACNLRCVFCPQSDPPGTMTFGLMEYELFERVVAAIERSTICAGLSLFLAGEPLMNKNLPRMIALARERLQTPPLIATNGTLLTKEVGRALVEAGAGDFLIDFCADAAHYESMCPPAAWERVRANIQALGDTMRASGAAGAIRLKNMDWRGKTDEERRLSLSALRSLFGTAPPYRYEEYKLHNWSGDFSAKAGERYGYRTSVDKKKRGYNPCSHLWFMMNIHHDGTVSLCCRDTMKGAVIGDVTRSSLIEIWNGPDMVRMRELMIEKRYDEIPICRSCDRIWTGSYSGGSPLRMANLFIRRKISSWGRRRRS
jgi:MoaA/NifB/PqqE/SkfB family radical SAM enzyme